MKINFAYTAETTTEGTNFIPPLEQIILDSVADSVLKCTAGSSLLEIKSGPDDRLLDSGKLRPGVNTTGNLIQNFS